MVKVCGGEGEWQGGTEDESFGVLWGWNDLRKKLVHGRMDSHDVTNLDQSLVPPIDEARTLVQGFQKFLDWLRNPTGAIQTGSFGGDSRYPLRVYPEIVALNLKTTTRSGITSVRYLLRDIGSHRSELRLYTSQPASVAGCYY